MMEATFTAARAANVASIDNNETAMEIDRNVSIIRRTIVAYNQLSVAPCNAWTLTAVFQNTRV